MKNLSEGQVSQELDDLFALVPPQSLDFEIEYPHRTFYNAEVVGVYNPTRTLTRARNRAEANVVSSLCVNGKHAPALDIDFPCRLVPSATAGHFHLLLDQEMEWKTYKRLLKALWKAGVIERGYYKMSVKQKMSTLRLPEKKKPIAKKAVKPVPITYSY